MSRRSSGRIASFCAGGRACLRRMPAKTLAMCRLAVQPFAALRIAPGLPGKPPFDRGHRQRRNRLVRRCQVGDVKTNHLGRRGQGVRPTHPAPAGKVALVLGIGFQRVFRCGRLRISACRLHQPVQRIGPGKMRRQGGSVVQRRCALVLFVLIGAIWRG